MRIAFDNDGTLTNFDEFIYDNAPKYFKKKHNMNIVNWNGYDVDEIFDIKNTLIKRNKSLSEEQAEKECKRIVDEFWFKFFFKYCMKTPFRPGVKKTINKLYDEGNEIFIISSRKKTCEDSLVGKFVRMCTKMQFIRTGVKYHKMLLLPNDEKKIAAIKENYIDEMVDDKPEILKPVSLFTNAVCMNTSYNIDHDISHNVTRVNSYENGEMYNAILKVIKEDKKSLLPDETAITDIPSRDKIWLKNYTKGDQRWALQKMSPYDRMIMGNIHFPNDYIFSYFGKRMKASEFEKGVSSCAKALIHEGVGKGDKVVLLVANTPETVVMIGALLKIMATIVPISPTESENAIGNKLKSLTPKLVYMVDYWNDKEKRYVSEKVKPLCEEIGIKKKVFSTVKDSMPIKYNIAYTITTELKNPKPKYDTSFQSFDNFIEMGENIKEEPILEYKNDYTAAIVYTGGTVEPKAVMLSPDNLDAETRHFLNTQIGIHRNEKISGFLPYDHVYGLLINLIVPVSKGMEIVLNPKLERKKIDEFFVKEKINNFAGIPVLVDEILKNPKVSKADLHHVKQIFLGSDSISDIEIKRTTDFFEERNSHITIINGHGLSETTAMAAENGIPIIGMDTKIVEPGTQDELSYNQVGELCYSGDTIMQGYYKDPIKTKKALQTHEDGKVWLHTGDLSYIDETGHINYQGRLGKDVIKVSGQAVNLYAVGEIIEKHPMVKKCIVIGTSDVRKGHVPVAIIKLQSDCPLNPNLESDITGFFNQQLSYYECPKSIIFVDELPLTSRGKIDRNTLETVYNSNRVLPKHYVKIQNPIFCERTN